MTMLSDERREVAKRLRRLHLGGANKDLIELTLSDAVGAWHENGMSWDYITERLADLIDPTCHVSDEEVTHQPTLDAIAVHVYTCDTCSSTFYMGDVCMHPEPLYCPYCGARVVDGGDA